MPDQVKKILIIRFSSLGDIVLTEPVPRVLKEIYPQAQIDYLTKKVFLPVVELFKTIDKIYTWDDKINVIKQLKHNQYDLVIDLHDKLNSWIVKRLISGSKCITYSKQHLRRLLLTHRLSKNAIYSTLNLYFTVFQKISDQYAQYAFTDQKIPASLYPVLHVEKQISPQIIDVFNNFGINPGKTLIGIFPGASYETKQYPGSSFSSFINRVPESWNCQFILLGSYDEKYICTRIRNNCDIKPVDLCGYFDIRQLIGFCANLNGVISNDSGPMHISAALGLPQIAIFGSTHTSLGFRPLNKKAIIMESDIKCQPCTLHGQKECPKGHFNCMRNIKPTNLYDQFKFMLEKYILNID